MRWSRSTFPCSRLRPRRSRARSRRGRLTYGKALFDGFRGAPPADRTALIDVLLRISALVELVPELLELDLNPVIVHAHGAVAVDARVRLTGEAPL